MLHLPTLLLQIGVILVMARLLGRIFQLFRQPQVLGEMAAGILLGPSFLGWLAPDLSVALFPSESLGILNGLSQIGLILFMFLVGLDLDPKALREHGYTAGVTSPVSIIAPFLLGTALARYLYLRLAPDDVPFLHFALFMGTAMSITAFPVLARILTERSLLQTPVGMVAIACAAVDDVTAWCILAGVVLLVRSTGDWSSFWLTLLGSLAYVALVVFGIRRIFAYLTLRSRQREMVSPNLLAAILLLVLSSAWITEWLGIHALFGAFVVGAVMPRERGFTLALRDKLEGLTVVLLLPLFFALTGLRTSLGLVHSPEMWVYCVLIIATAVGGKFGASTLAARLTGMSWREAGALGILLNTRGLIELVVLNVGLEIGVISPAVFTMMVLMALVTTFMTTPLLDWIYLPRHHQQAHVPSVAQQ